MGQQQLLLLVLGIVIVGLAVVVGIQAFNENQTKSQIDNYTATGVGMAGEIIAWYQKPTAQGGGGGVAANLGSLTIDKLGYDLTASETTVWSGFQFTGTVKNGTIRYLGTSTTHPFLHIHQMPRVTGMMRVEVHAFGPRPECIVTRTNRFNVGTAWSDGKSENAPPDNPDAARCSW